MYYVRVREAPNGRWQYVKNPFAAVPQLEFPNAASAESLAKAMLARHYAVAVAVSNEAGRVVYLDVADLAACT